MIRSLWIKRVTARPCFWHIKREREKVIPYCSRYRVKIDEEVWIENVPHLQSESNGVTRIFVFRILYGTGNISDLSGWAMTHPRERSGDDKTKEGLQHRVNGFAQLKGRGQLPFCETCCSLTNFWASFLVTVSKNEREIYSKTRNTKRIKANYFK